MIMMRFFSKRLGQRETRAHAMLARTLSSALLPRDMHYRKIGIGSEAPLTVSAIGLGRMSMSEFYGKPNEKESIATLNEAVQLGINFFDTADTYGQRKIHR